MSPTSNPFRNELLKIGARLRLAELDKERTILLKILDAPEKDIEKARAIIASRKTRRYTKRNKEYWKKKFRVSGQALAGAVRAVGKSAKKVEAYLKDK